MKALHLMMALFAFTTTAKAATNHEIINHVSHNVILATYNNLAAQAQILSESITQLAASPSEENLMQAQEAWRNTRIHWESSESFLFGPVDSLGIDPMLDTWPLNKLDLDNVLKSNRTISLDFVRALGTNLQGFHTIEYLLFGDGLHSNTKPVSTITAKQFEYLTATAQLLAEHTGALAHAWSANYDPEDPATPGYVQIISQPGFDNPFYSADRAVMEEFVQGMIGILDEVANGKMSDPLGANIDSANIALVESPFSWNSLNDFTHNIGSVYAIFTGTHGNTHGPGVKALVEKVNPELAQKVEQDIIHCMNLIQAIRPAGGGDFGQAILTHDGRQRTQAAIEALNELSQLMESEVLPTLDM